MIDKKKRSVAKSISWRVLAFLVLSAVSFLATRSFSHTTFIAVIYTVVQILIYFLHERLWNNIKWGRSGGISVQITGLSGSGKSTLSGMVSESLKKKGLQVEVIDGDEYRKNLCSDLGFSKEDRMENIRRFGYVSKILQRNRVIAIVAAINPYESIRRELKQNINNMKTIYLKCDLESAMKRDEKGLYKRALLPDGHPDKIYNFTGISDPFEEPENPDLVVETDKESPGESANKIVKFILKNV